MSDNIFKGVWIGWSDVMPSDIDSDVFLTMMTARPDTELDMSKLSNTPLPPKNKSLLNIGGVWEGGEQNNWSAFFSSYSSGDTLKTALSQRKFSGVVLDLETASGEEPDIDLNQLTGFIEHCKSLGFYCFVTCISGNTADYVTSLEKTGVDAVIPMLYNGGWTDLFRTNWIAAFKATGAPLLAGIAYKDKEEYTFLDQYPSKAGLFVWGYGSGGGEATGQECQDLIDLYLP